MSALLLFKILLTIFILDAACLGRECDSNGVSCISCTDYQQCSGGAPTGPIFSCKNGVECSEQPLLEHCWVKLSCYALNECTEVGIFPDATVESNYFVCLPDSGSGFIKYEFACPEGEFYDSIAQMCVSKSVTLETTVIPTSFSTPATSTATPTTPPTAETSTAATTSTTPATSTATPTTPPTAETSTETTTLISTPKITTTTPIPTPTSPPSVFLCTAPGIFPNPNNCKMYFRCSTSLKVFNYICPGTSYFNENLLKCSLSITPTCREQILLNATTSTTPSRTTPAATTPVPTPLPTIATTTSVPTQPTISTTPVPTQPSPATTAAPTQPPTATTPAPTQPTISTTIDPLLPCTAPGIFPNPNNCKMYFRCSTSLKVFNYICPGTSYFNENLLKCSLIITPICREQILLNTTTSTTRLTTTPATTTPIPTPLPTTTTTKSIPATTTAAPTQPPTIKTQRGSTPFPCSAAGTFENPFDCKTYYRCSSTGETFLYVCPGDSYYNEFTRRCGLTITPRCISKLKG